MKRWRFNTLLLIAILSSCLVTISADDADDDDGVTIEAEKIVSIFEKYRFNFRHLLIFFQFVGTSKARI